jgi:hypothetical protein
MNDAEHWPAGVRDNRYYLVAACISVCNREVSCMYVCTEEQLSLVLDCDVCERDIAALSFVDWEGNQEASSVSEM